MHLHPLPILGCLLTLLSRQAFGFATPKAMDSTSSTASDTSYRAPLYRPGGADSVDDTYIVKFFVEHTLEEHYEAIGTNLSETGDLIRSIPLLPGYHARLEDQSLLERIRRDTGVQYVEQDVYLPRTEPISTNVTAFEASHHARRWNRETFENGYYHRAILTANGALNTPVLNEQYDANFIENAGSGVYVYVLDTGIRLTHNEFDNGSGTSRAVNFQGATTSPYCAGETMDDVKGHGTLIASAVAGTNIGMGIGANIVNVKTQCDSAPITVGNQVAAMAAVTQEHLGRRSSNAAGFKGSVINMSFGGPYPTKAVFDLLTLSRRAGMLLVSAAGNNDSPTLMYPCGYSGVICVGGSDQNYERWSVAGANPPSGSNYGPFIAVFAPAAGISLASNLEDDGVKVASGTSASAGMVSGILSTWISYEALTASADTATDRLTANQQTGLLQNLPNGVPNNLANNGNLLPPQGVTGQLPYLDAPAEGIAALSSAITVTQEPTYTYDYTTTAIETFQTYALSGTNVVTISWESTTTTITVNPTQTVLSSTSAAAYCYAFQDPDHCNPGYCSCSNGGAYSFATGSTACPYTATPPASLSVTSPTTICTTTSTTNTASPASFSFSPTSSSA